MEIRRLVLAVDDMAAMVDFHDAVFDTGLRALDGPDGFHLGSFAGIELLLCPNEIAEVDARQNRHQFRLAVDDPAGLLDTVVRHGGRRLDDHDPASDVCGFADPDGNTHEVVGR